MLTSSEISSDIVISYVTSIGYASLENIGMTEPTFLATADVDVAATLAFISTRTPTAAAHNSFIIRRKLS